PYLELHRRAAPAGSDEHATAARRVVDRVTDEIAQYAAQQHRIARHRDARRDEAKPDPFEPCRFGELRFDLFEHRTEPDGLLTSAAGGLEQTESVDKLVELVTQFACRIVDPCQLHLLDTTLERFRQDVVCADDDLQRLAQIVTGNSEQRGAQIIVALCDAATVIETARRDGPNGE